MIVLVKCQTMEQLLKHERETFGVFYKTFKYFFENKSKGVLRGSSSVLFPLFLTRTFFNFSFY